MANKRKAVSLLVVAVVVGAIGYLWVLPALRPLCGPGGLCGAIIVTLTDDQGREQVIRLDRVLSIVLAGTTKVSSMQFTFMEKVTSPDYTQFKLFTGIPSVNRVSISLWSGASGGTFLKTVTETAPRSSYTATHPVGVELDAWKAIADDISVSPPAPAISISATDILASVTADGDYRLVATIASDVEAITVLTRPVASLRISGVLLLTVAAGSISVTGAATGGGV